MRHPTGLAVLLAALAVTAGCAGDGGTATPGTETQTATPEQTTEPPPDNPWGQETVGVVVNATDRDITGEAEAAVAFWNERIDEHADYEVTLEYAGPAGDADGRIELRLVDSIEMCDMTYQADGFQGCAPQIDAGDTARPHEVVELSAGQTDAQLNNTIKHELGHVLGVDHGGGPAWIMSDGNGTGSAPNATEREHPWQYGGDIEVAVRDGMNHSATVESGVREAAEAYNGEHAALLPDGAEVVVVGDWREADVVLQEKHVGGEYTVHVRPGSYSETFGLDWDSDGALELYTATYVELKDVDPERAERHAGYWIGVAAGNDAGELPDEYSP